MIIDQPLKRGSLLPLLFLTGTALGLFFLFYYLAFTVLLPLADIVLGTGLRSARIQVTGDGLDGSIFIGPVIGAALALSLFIALSLLVLRQWAADKTECPYCLSLVPAEATRCAFCAGEFEEESGPDSTSE